MIKYKMGISIPQNLKKPHYKLNLSDKLNALGKRIITE